MTRDEAIAAVRRQVEDLRFSGAVMLRALRIIGPVYEGGRDLTEEAQAAIAEIAAARQDYAEDELTVLRAEIERAREWAYDALEDLLAQLDLQE